MLRAFCDKFSRMKDKQSMRMHDSIAACIWKTDEYDEPDTDQLQIDSEVASDADKDEFLRILREGKVDPAWWSRYAKNFSYFLGRIDKLAQEWPTYTALFSSRIINNVILLPIEVDNQDTALRIFSTLNDRGLPLSDAGIFKSQIYKHFSGEGRRKEFGERWKALEEGANEILRPSRGAPMDELFTRYMYFQRALLGIRDTTTQGLRDFYARDGYAILREDGTLDDLKRLLGFWQRVDAREDFSDEALGRLAVLQYAPNGMYVAQIADVSKPGGRPKVIYVDKDNGTPYLSGRQILQTTPIGLKYLSSKSAAASSKYVLGKGDVVFQADGRAEESLGFPSMVMGERVGWLASGHVGRFIPRSMKDAGRLWLATASNVVQEQIAASACGSVVDSVYPETLETVVLPKISGDESD